MYKLERSILDLYCCTDKEAAFGSLKKELRLSDEGEALRYLITHENFKNPKNFRPLDFLQFKIRKHLKNNSDYILNRLWVSSKAYIELCGKESIVGARVLDFGCGRFDPLLQALVLYVNGADFVLAADLDTIIDSEFACFHMIDLLVELIAKPKKWKFSEIHVNEYIRRCQKINLDALENGDLKGGVQDIPIDYYVGDIRDYKNSGDFSLIISFSVLEHVIDIREVMKFIYGIMAPNGRLISQIDFSDHRQNQAGYNFWTFMLQDGTPQPGINGLRLSQMLGVFEDVGFKIQYCNPSKVSVPEDIIQRIKPEWSVLSLNDLATISAWISVLK